MNKQDLIEIVARSAACTKTGAGAAIDAAIAEITKTLKKGKTVTLVGFGTFGTRKRAARVGVNPQTGARIKIAARTVATFKPGQALKDAVR